MRLVCVFVLKNVGENFMQREDNLVEKGTTRYTVDREMVARKKLQDSQIRRELGLVLVKDKDKLPLRQA